MFMLKRFQRQPWGRHYNAASQAVSKVGWKKGRVACCHSSQIQLYLWEVPTLKKWNGRYGCDRCLGQIMLPCLSKFLFIPLPHSCAGCLDWINLTCFLTLATTTMQKISRWHRWGSRTMHVRSSKKHWNRYKNLHVWIILQCLQDFLSRVSHEAVLDAFAGLFCNVSIHFFSFVSCTSC